MSVITTNDVIIGTKKGVTWGTEIDVTGGIYMYASQISVSGGFADFLPRDTSLLGKRTFIARLAETVNVKMTCDLTYHQGWLAPFSSIFGTESSPTETTAGQGDYSETIDVANSTAGTFWTLAWCIETDRVLAIPSVKWTDVTVTQAINGAGSISFSGIGDSILQSSTNTYAKISGLTQYFYETCTLGGTNHYFRINADGGAGLSSTNNTQILNYSFTLARPHQTTYGLRSATTQNTLEPLQLGPISSTLNVTASVLDDAIIDLWGLFYGKTSQKAEIFVDGSQIGTGVNRSLKLQIPYAVPMGTIAPGHDVANNNSLFTPSLTFQCLKRSAAPTGMAITDIARLTPIQLKSSKWTT